MGMFTRLKLNLETIERWLKRLILISGVLTILIVLTIGATRITMNSEFCSKCHVMTPEYVTWKASSHARFSCTDCHVKPGIGNLLLNNISATKLLYLYYTGTYNRPIEMDHMFEDQICTGCHSMKREFTPSGDLIIPHDKHAAKNVLCIQCHDGVAHGAIAARRLTEDGRYDAWTMEVGRMQMTKENTEPKMNRCLACHMEPAKFGIKDIETVTQACEACHTQISMPPDHKVENFTSNHSLLVEKEGLEYCNKCHSYSLEAKDVPGEDPVARYARGNVFCYDCHQKRPVGHTGDWGMIHKKDVPNGDVSGCLVCHNNAKPTPENRAVPTYCAKCHSKTNNGAEPGGEEKPDGKDNTSGQNGSSEIKFEKYHPGGWLTYHPTVVKEKGASNEGCWNCHDTTHCSRCHTNSL
ncbi:cytochrome c3 family protein [Phosphitispora sp. TUW77]|uniref:cytochrome c3 family protein n=1 Tax=Phosphitispora sp. TUW77 TaxID=3152361 RepID=UPI003AB21F23